MDGYGHVQVSERKNHEVGRRALRILDRPMRALAKTRLTLNALYDNLQANDKFSAMNVYGLQ